MIAWATDMCLLPKLITRILFQDQGLRAKLSANSVSEHNADIEQNSVTHWETRPWLTSLSLLAHRATALGSLVVSRIQTQGRSLQFGKNTCL